MKNALLLGILFTAATVVAQPAVTPPVPQKHIPTTVLFELRALESQFDQALSHDCAPEKCVSKGCEYGDHVVVDMPRATSLPGIEQSEGVGSVPAQEYLTQARCDFAYEKAVSPKDVQALVRRLELRLSKGWLKVTVGKQLLEPISPTLSESPPPKPPPALPVPAPKTDLKPEVPRKWELGVAMRELWLTLLPHFAWMIAIVLATLAAMFIIWSLRRLGRETLEEKALAAQLAAAPAEVAPPPEEEKTDANAVPDVISEEARVAALFAEEQRRAWTERIAQAQLAEDEGGVVELLRDWLKNREFGLLAKAIFLFGDKLSLAFSSNGELAVRKVEFAEYLQSLDEKSLPSDGEFFRTLNHHVISSSLLAQADADIYQSLREEFGSAGVAHLIERMPARHGALLFALVPGDTQREVGRNLSTELRIQVAGELLVSNRISEPERRYLFETLDAARAGKPIPAAPKLAAHDIIDRGRVFDAAGALSVLLPHIDTEDRHALFMQARERSSGAFPLWYEDILYPDMLLRLPDEVQADLLLEVDVRGLAGWSSMQQPAWQDSFLGKLAPSMQSAVRANMAFVSRADQLRMAQRGHDELVLAVKRLVARGKVSFSEIVA